MASGGGVPNRQDSISVRPASREDIAATVDLGNASKRTLGLLPPAAYEDAVDKGTLVVACDSSGAVIAYALYGLARGRIRLTHLCVAEACRGQGMARRLVEFISERHHDYAGILVKCRRDYNLGGFWIGLGFTQLSEKPGRGRGDRTLVNWWLDHHHATLFTRAEEVIAVRAAVDLNVLRDLTDKRRSDHEEAASLTADQISDRLELVRTATLDREMDVLSDELRALCLRGADGLRSVRAPQGVVDAAQAQLLSEASPSGGYPSTPQDERDLAYVAEAAAAGIGALVTRDEDLQNLLGPAARRLFGLRILRPAELVVRVDEIVRADAYRPAALLATPFTQRLVPAGGEGSLLGLADQPTRERQSDLKQVIRGLTAAGHGRVGWYGADGALRAVYVSYQDGNALVVPLLRVARDILAATLARQLLFVVRQLARDQGCVVVRVTDAHVSRPIRLAMEEDGFVEHDGGWHAFVLDVCAPAAQVEHAAVTAARSAGAPEPPPLRPDLPAMVAADLEQAWWPAKVTDSALPVYLVPIRQQFSLDLLGVPGGLFPRPTGLGLSREHVYYRSARGPRMEAPARILWYMSGGRSGHGHPAGVIACSGLDEVVVGPPSELESRFAHLGVWTLDEIEQVAASGQAQALRFSRTEVFPNQVLLRRLKGHAVKCGHSLVLQGPCRISSALFKAVYDEGRRR